MPRATENRHHAHDAAPDRRPDGASYPTRVRAPPSFLSVSWSDRCQVTMSQEQRNNDDKPDDTEDDTHTDAEGDGEPEAQLGDEDAARAAESDAAFAARLPPRTTATNGDDHSTRAAPERTRDEPSITGPILSRGASSYIRWAEDRLKQGRQDRVAEILATASANISLMDAWAGAEHRERELLMIAFAEEATKTQHGQGVLKKDAVVPYLNGMMAYAKAVERRDDRCVHFGDWTWKKHVAYQGLREALKRKEKKEADTGSLCTDGLGNVLPPSMLDKVGSNATVIWAEQIEPIRRWYRARIRSLEQTNFKALPVVLKQVLWEGHKSPERYSGYADYLWCH